MKKNWKCVILGLSAHLAFAGAETAWASLEAPTTYACSVSATIGKKTICSDAEFTLPLHPTRDGLSGLTYLPEACRPLNDSQISVDLNTANGNGRASLKGLQGDSLKPIGQADMEFDVRAARFDIGVTQEAAFFRREKQISVRCSDPDQIPAALIYAPVQWDRFYSIEVRVSQPLVIEGRMMDSRAPASPPRSVGRHYANPAVSFWVGQGSELANHGLWISGIRTAQSVEATEAEITLRDDQGKKAFSKVYTFTRSLSPTTQFQINMNLVEAQN